MAVPFGFSLTDIAQTIRLCREIHTRCFTDDQGANLKYKRLIDDIKTLGISLERLQDVVQRYERQYPQPWHSDAHHTSMWPRLTGDFLQTLRECNSLLSDHYSQVGQRKNISSNIRWWLSTEGEVDNLTARLRWHITKAEFYARPEEFDAVIRNGRLLQKLSRQMTNVERMMRNGPEPSNALSGDFLDQQLEAKFEFEFNQNKPSWFVEGSGWPLKEGFTAFGIHFEKGTVGFYPNPELGNVPGMPEYLHFAKAVWILEKIRQSDHFMTTSTDSVWAEYMTGADDYLRSQIHRFEVGELEKPSLQEILTLPSDHFNIDQDKGRSSVDTLDPAFAGPVEEKILEIALPSDATTRESVLRVFRENETYFRLMISTRQADVLIAQSNSEVEVNMDRHRLVPAYWNPDYTSLPRHKFLLFNEQGRRPREFCLLNHEDVKKLQRALTGYRVHHDMPVAQWCINGSAQPGNFGTGVLQLWQYKPLPSIVEQGPSGASDTNSSMATLESSGPSCNPCTPTSEASNEYRLQTPLSPDLVNAQFSDGKGYWTSRQKTTRVDSPTSPPTSRSFSCSSTVTAKPKNGDNGSKRYSSRMSDTTLLSSSNFMSPIQGPRSKGVEVLRPELPVLILFTMCHNKYTFLHLTLQESIHVEPKLCGCRKASLHCNRVIITSKTALPIRILHAEQEGPGGLGSWDLSVFRYPRSEKFHKTSIREQVRRLELKFRDEDEKKEFLAELTSLENNRATNENDYKERIRGMERARS